MENKTVTNDLSSKELLPMNNDDLGSSKEKDDGEAKKSSNILNHSNRRVIVHNVCKFTKMYEMEKQIQTWIKDTEIKVAKIKKPPKTTWAILTLEEEAMVDQLIDILNDGKMNKKGGVLRAQKTTDMDNETNKKRDRDGSNNSNDGHKRSRQEDYVKTPDNIRDAVTPLWRLTYEEQIDLKSRTMVNKCLSKIVQELKSKVRTLQKDKQRQISRGEKSNDNVFDWMKSKKPIDLKPIIKAPKQFEYRNKSELTFGYMHSYDDGCNTKNEIDGKIDMSEKDQNEMNAKVGDKERKIIKTPAVGFMAGGWAGGVSSPHYAANIPDIVCGISEIVNEFLRTSPIPPYLAKEHRGVWRFITIRSSDRTKECMIVICHAPASGGAGAKDDSDDYSAVFESEKERLVKMLTDKIPKPKRMYSSSAEAEEKSKCTEDDTYCDYQVTSLFFQEFDGLSNPQPQHPVQHLFGKKFLEEKLLQCTFQISPGAFFQVTTEGAEILYQLVVDRLKEVTPNPKDTLLFDVCCGTGTIGLTSMKEGAVGNVVGIDISEPAIKDAIINAEKNGYSGTGGCTKFVASRAESAMYNEIRQAGRNRAMVAVVDPAREGLHKDVCKALRQERRLKRIIYVSCNPTGSLIRDAASLCSPQTKKFGGVPFKITSAQPVDMFPLTEHCEMVMVFDRMTEEELNGGEKKSSKEATTDEVNTGDASTKPEVNK
mmetsp:Transcript_15277/g.18594  ORF Transcript_15277/g.18594 Transcript_15277/m.18594 type:complete len:709 (+) Transcript_15277:57-2183(+)